MAISNDQVEWEILISRGETKNLDFKRPMAWDNLNRGSLTEDIAAMANTRDGGTILVGISEGEDGNAVLEGVSQEQAASFEPTKVIEFVASLFQPPVDLHIERPFRAREWVSRSSLADLGSTGSPRRDLQLEWT
jgi:predicted HTH transcriptional regulator